MNSITFSEERNEETCYGYCNDYQPHAVKRMFDYKNGMLYDMRWDEAGNLGQVSMSKPGEMFEAGRFLFWTEDCCGPRPCGANRLYTVADKFNFSYYAYDHTGQRTLKMTGDASAIDMNAQMQQIVSGLNRVTLYPSPYLVLTEQGYTKHYYAGADRVCARLGSGGLDHDTACISRNEEVSTRVENLFWHGLKLVDAKEFKPEIIKDLQLVDIHGKELDWLKNVDIEKLLMRLRISVKPDPWSIHKIIDDLVRERPDDEPDVYFYHSDHLGGASWITDVNGKPVQHLQYLPFGEPYVNQHPAGYQERFTFTGKERDEETGYGYFGARYMDHELMTMWLSVDPMADKYPSISPYAYCAWNPVKLVDPDGREWDKPKDKEQARKMEEAVNDRISDISTEIQSKRDKIEKLKTNAKMDPSKKDKKIAALNDELSNLEYQKGLLADFVVGLHDLRDDPDRRYTFNPSEDAFQTNTFQEVNGVIPINYQEVPAIGMANLVHETTHAIQDYRGQMYVGNLMSCERNAYSTQYAYSSDSFKYINNNICPSSRISEAWVRGVYFFKGGKPFYPYMDIK